MAYTIDVEYTNTLGERVVSEKVSGSHIFHLTDAKSPDQDTVEVQCVPDWGDEDPDVVEIHFKLKPV